MTTHQYYGYTAAGEKKMAMSPNSLVFEDVTIVYLEEEVYNVKTKQWDLEISVAKFQDAGK